MLDMVRINEYRVYLAIHQSYLDSFDPSRILVMFRPKARHPLYDFDVSLN